MNYSYDALAASVRIKDITSCSENRALLHRLKNNDPALTGLYIEEMYEGEEGVDDVNFYVGDEDDFGWLGYFIGENDTLERVSVCHLPACSDQVENFFIGMQRNKSITSMRMEYNIGHEVARHFAEGLHRCRSLETYYGPVTTEIIKSLTTLPMLERVYVWRNEDMAISREECVALRGLLTDATEIKQLYMSQVGLGNTGMKILAEGITCNSFLTDGVLDLSENGIGDQGVQALALSLATNTNLRELRLSDNIFGDVGLEALADSLARNRALRVLTIAGNTTITASGLRSVSRFLRSSGLEDLCLDGINISDEGLNTLADALSINQSLVSLSLQCERDGGSIGDDGLRALALGLSHNSYLKSLDLSGHTAITASGLRSLEEYLQSPSCALEEFNLDLIDIGDKGAQALADALVGNKSLNNLHFDVRSITSRGWRSFLKLVCDSSSPNSLYLSNQTLCELGSYWNPSGSDVKNQISSCLKINNDCRKSPRFAAKSKILHLFPDLDMIPLFQWNLKLLPLLKCWFRVSSANKAFTARIRNIELSCIYKFVRGLPVLIVDDLRRNLARQVERIRAKIGKLEEEERRLMQG